MLGLTKGIFMSMTYAEKLKDPRWQKKRLEIMQRDMFCCYWCQDTDSTLHVHHLRYSGNPWEASDEYLITICESCHKDEHANPKNGDKNILKALREKRFNQGQVNYLSTIIDRMVIRYDEDVTLSVLEWILADKDRLFSLYESYFSYLKEKNKHNG